LVYCDRCGARFRKHDAYCRVCGRLIYYPSFFWRITHELASKEGQAANNLLMENGTRRLGTVTTENASATDTTTASRLDVRNLTQTEKTLSHAEHRKIELMPSDPASAVHGLLLGQKTDTKSDIPSFHIPKTRRRTSTWAGGIMTAVGAAGLGLAILYTSTVLAFIGLGLAFWGALLLFIRPQHYVRSDLMDSTALASLRTIDRVMSGLGYYEKGVYLPAGNPEKAVVFLPSEPFSKIPNPKDIGDKTFLDNPKGMIIIPPGLSLAALIQKELGTDFEKLTLNELRERLNKVLIEDLEIVRDFEMNVDKDYVHFKFVDSIYAEFCGQLRSAQRLGCSLGCPICSAMACILCMVTRKPVSFEHDEFSPDGKILESSYRILEWS